MSRQAIEDAYIAGFNDGRDSVGKVADNDVNTHCMLGFDGWYQKSLDTLDRSPITANADVDGWIPWDGSARLPHDLTHDTIVQIRFGSGQVSKCIDRAGDWGWTWDSNMSPSEFHIIAYRVVKP